MVICDFAINLNKYALKKVLVKITAYPIQYPTLDAIQVCSYVEVHGKKVVTENWHSVVYDTDPIELIKEIREILKEMLILPIQATYIYNMVNNPSLYANIPVFGL